jgi:hypothetical protein
MASITLPTHDPLTEPKPKGAYPYWCGPRRLDVEEAQLRAMRTLSAAVRDAELLLSVIKEKDSASD